MVNPQTLLVDLDLPRGDGYRALGRLAGQPGRARTWILCGGVAPLAEAGSLVVSGAMERSRANFSTLSDLARAWRKDCGGTSAGADQPASNVVPAFVSAFSGGGWFGRSRAKRFCRGPVVGAL